MHVIGPFAAFRLAGKRHEPYTVRHFQLRRQKLNLNLNFNFSLTSPSDNISTADRDPDAEPLLDLLENLVMSCNGAPSHSPPTFQHKATGWQQFLMIKVSLAGLAPCSVASRLLLPSRRTAQYKSTTA